MRFSNILLAFAFAALPAIAKPNFSGDWKLNVSKSTFGQMPAPNSMTSKIAHEDPTLKNSTKQSSARGDFESESNYTTDGKECTNQMFGNPVKSTVKWDGDALLIDTKAKFGDNDVTIQDKWTLSEDGKTLTIVRLFKSSMGEGGQTLVLDKQ
jgi:hypothetical protein